MVSPKKTHVSGSKACVKAAMGAKDLRFKIFFFKIFKVQDFLFAQNDTLEE